MENQKNNELFVENADWSKFSISPNLFLRIIESKEQLASFLSSTPKSIQKIDLSKFTNEQLDHINEISSIWEFDIWESNWGYFFTIKWLHDVTDWFIWYTPELLGYWDSVIDAFDSFYNKLIDCPDWVVYTDKWYKDYYWDDVSSKFLEKRFTERKQKNSSPQK